MAYIKKLYPILLVALVAAIIFSIGASLIFSFDWSALYVLYFSFLAGTGMVFIQRETVSYKFIDKLFIGSIIYGFLTILFFIFRMSLVIANSTPPSFHPFYYYINYGDSAMTAAAFAFICFKGGLVAIVGKGLYFIKKERINPKV